MIMSVEEHQDLTSVLNNFYALNMKPFDIYLRDDAIKLLHNRFIVIIGDSIQRGIYKDLVLLLQKNKYLNEFDLKKKGEFSFSGDQLIEGGQKGIMHNGKNYREIRQFQTDYNLIRFYFVTRCYNTYIESILTDLSEDPKPDVVIMNSCLWDITRYGKTGVEMYKENLEKLFNRFKECLSKDCLILWNATLPISRDARGGFIVPEISFLNHTLRLDILEANFYARQIVAAHGYDFLDLHFYFRENIHRRANDGIHWDMTAHRRITNLLLSHMSDAWGETSPGRIKEREESPPKRFDAPVENFNRRPVATVSPVNFGITRTLINNNVLMNNNTSNIIPSPNQNMQLCGPFIDNSTTSFPFQDQSLSSNFQWQPYGNYDYQPPNRNRLRCRDQPYAVPFQNKLMF